MSEQARQQFVSQSSIKNGKRKALIIGISRYDHNNKFRDLDFCEYDANEVYKILKDQDYDIPSNAFLVGRVEWSKMRDEMVDFFADNTLKPEDTLFFYFSGHGYLHKNTGRTYLSTSEIDPERPEKRAIPFDELTNYLNYSKSERIIAVLDSCYSGALEIAGKGGEEGEDDEESAKSEKGDEIASLAEVNMRKTVERLIKSGQGKCVLASSLEEQKSFKMQDKPYSTFTYFLTQGLRGAEGESVDANGYVTPELLGSYVNKKIYELPTIKQNPIRKIEVTGLMVLAYHPKLAKRQQQKEDYLLQLLKDGKIEEFNENRKKDNYSRLSLYQVDLSKRVLSNADLRNSDLNLANLEEAKLEHVVLVKTSLFSANLSNANLSHAKLENAKLESANLSNANLSHAKLYEARLVSANLVSANLVSANLVRANLSHANLLHANLLHANLQYAYLSGTNLSNANLLHAKFSSANLSGAYLSSANLEDAELSSANLSYAKLVSTDLSNAYLSYANLSGAYLSNPNLLHANLSDADLSRANLVGANLSGADLSRAKLYDANLTSSIIIGLQFQDDKSYPLCKNANFDSAIIDDEKLSRHFHYGNAKNVPPAAKNKKELREKLEERGFNRQTIDQCLSFSSLLDSSQKKESPAPSRDSGTTRQVDPRNPYNDPTLPYYNPDLDKKKGDSSR